MERARKRRKVQADKVSSILKERFPGEEYNSKPFAVLRDFNDSPESEFVSPLVKDAGLENVIDRLPVEER